MTASLSPTDIAKKACADEAATLVESGMKVGLGTGSTAVFLVQRLGERVASEGLDFTAVPTSTATANLARDVGINVVTLDEARWLDLTIDGADEIDPEFNLIKGGGGAHLQEKVVATASDRMVVIADATKTVATLGAFPLPVEVLKFGMSTTQMLLEEMLEGLDVMGNKITPRMKDGALFVTDEGNHILDMHLGRIGNARQLALVLNQVPGVVENGLFIDICDSVIIGNSDGSVETKDIDTGGTTKQGDALEDNIFADIAE